MYISCSQPSGQAFPQDWLIPDKSIILQPAYATFYFPPSLCHHSSLAWLILIALPGGVNRWLYASSDDINLFYERLSPAFLHRSRYVSYMSPFSSTSHASTHKSPAQCWDFIVIWMTIKNGCLHNSFFSWLKLIWMIAPKCANRRMACLLMKISTHYFLRHSVARSILNSGRLTKPSAFSSCEV